jgi:phosphatidate cytidylyltransferase
MAQARGRSGNRATLRLGATELGSRLVSSVVMIIAALLATYQGGWVFAAFWLLAGLAVLLEWLAMTRCEPRLTLQATLGVILVGLSVIAFSVDRALVGSLAACLLAGAAALLCGRTSRDRGWAVAGFGYALVLAVVPPMLREDPRLGIGAILWMFSVVWASDIAAYFAGRRFGGPKLWPSVSPKKTWSGFLAGLLAAVAAGVLVAAGAERVGWSTPVGLGVVAVLSALASVLGQLGDLAESGLKRRFGVKDSSQLIPGHGGAMDRLDAFWAVSALFGAILAGAQGARYAWTAGG